MRHSVPLEYWPNKPFAWLSSSTKSKRFKRDWLKKKAAKSGSADDWTSHRLFRNSVNNIGQPKRPFYKSQINEVSDDQGLSHLESDDNLLGKESNNTKTDEMNRNGPEQM